MRENAQRFDTRQNMHNKEFEVFHYREPKPQAVEVHDHDFYEVYFLLNGDVSYWVEGKVYSLEPGDFLLINPSTLHRPIISEESSVYERIVLWINKEYLENFKENDLSLNQCFESVNDNTNNLIRVSSPQNQAELTSLLAALVRENYSDEFYNNFCAKSIFMQFMIKLNRILLKKEASSKTAFELSQNDLVSNVLDYISDHYNEELSLQMLASKYYVSKYHLSHEFTKKVGSSVYRYIMLKRLTAARQMLFEHITPGEVCFKCGFKDYTSFFRAFKAEYGISPKDINKQ